MADTFEKEDDSTLRVTKDIPATTKVTTYDFSFMKSQQESILKDQTRVAAELAEIDEFIAAAESLGITEPAKPEADERDEALVEPTPITPT